ncbi:hypothetical protein D1BOALGB6SA_8 [Olavius sp. associated proteobacterium Delta 1]|nr:hypothetical protein D1BOALGB6SA_8 [Olavius sp. associated proteobacterium Delta 1]
MKFKVKLPQFTWSDDCWLEYVQNSGININTGRPIGSVLFFSSTL